VLHLGFKHSYNAVHKNSAMQSTAVFLVDPDDPGRTEKPGR